MEDAVHTAIPLSVLATALICSLATAPANARARVFVASYGNDANPCTFGSPCKTFQQAVNVVDAGGEVTAIDSAGFGPISISKAVTITSPDGVEAGIVPTTGGNAINITAGANDAVVLRGLTLNGSGVGSNGVFFTSGASLTVTNCVVQNFPPSQGDGILIQPSSGTTNVTIINTIATNNGAVGIAFRSSGSANVTGIIDHVVTTGNQFGIAVNGTSTSATEVTISNSVASNNSFTGIAGAASGTALITLSIDNVTANYNDFGISVGFVTVFLGRSVIMGNFSTGIDNGTPNTFFTYKDNRINGNGTDIDAALNTSLLTQ
jgi:hypothetical protein